MRVLIAGSIMVALLATPVYAADAAKVDLTVEGISYEQITTKIKFDEGETVTESASTTNTSPYGFTLALMVNNMVARYQTGIEDDDRIGALGLGYHILEHLELGLRLEVQNVKSEDEDKDISTDQSAYGPYVRVEIPLSSKLAIELESTLGMVSEKGNTKTYIEPDEALELRELFQNVSETSSGMSYGLGFTFICQMASNIFLESAIEYSMENLKTEEVDHGIDGEPDIKVKSKANASTLKVVPLSFRVSI
ncbi:MAG: hypothetical protein AB7T49_13775 [Oligoflexales bacterium]